MKKIILLILSIICIIAIFFVGSRFINNAKNEIKQNKEIEEAIEKLSDEAKAVLNKEELIQDIKSIKEGKGLIYAKEEQDDMERRLVNRYRGNGYYCEKIYGGDCISYIFYSSVDDSEIFEYTKSYPMTNIE